MAALILQPARAGAQLNQLIWGTLLAARWRALGRQWVRRGHREALRELADDPHLLRDLGLTRDQALEEADKPFWR